MARTLADKARYLREWRARNRQKCREYNRAYYRDNSKRIVRNRKIRVYGVDPDRLSSKQNGRCAICGREEQLYIDHCHKTGAVRAMLCGGCNGGLGLFRDDPTALRNAAKYVIKHRRNRGVSA